MTAQNLIMGYEMVGMLGYGARSTIYAVKDQSGQQYALKRVVRATADDQRFIDQAINEHEIASKFNHRNLRQSFKLLRQREFLRVKEVYTLMEMVTGQDLESKKPRNMIDLCHVCQQIVQGLNEMHRLGYVHADMKPKNLVVNDSSVVKIIDFGQSCKTGTVKDRIQGTPDFIAPEQVKLRPITARTDVFNLGATMYWLLTDKNVPTMIAPAIGDQGMMRVPQAPFAPPKDLNPKVPPALSALVMDCIRTEPEDRPANMEALYARLTYAIKQIQSDPGSKPDITSKAGAPSLAVVKDSTKDSSKNAAGAIKPGGAHQFPDPTDRIPKP